MKTGFKSSWSLRASECFLGFISNRLSYFITVRITFTCILYPQWTHMISCTHHVGFLFHSSAKEHAKTRKQFETNFAKNEISPGQAASVFSCKVRSKTGICRSSGISGLYLQPVMDLSKSDCDCWKQPAAWVHKIVSNLTNYTCVGALTCLAGLIIKTKELVRLIQALGWAANQRKWRSLAEPSSSSRVFSWGEWRWLCKQARRASCNWHRLFSWWSQMMMMIIYLLIYVQMHFRISMHEIEPKHWRHHWLPLYGSCMVSSRVYGMYMEKDGSQHQGDSSTLLEKRVTSLKSPVLG